jgi:uncharacterized protein (TIGR00255 family)
MLSMTGFGQAGTEQGSWSLQATVRAVNHRFLDPVLRLPEVCRGDEAEVRRLVGERLARGRIEVTVEAVPLDDSPARVALRSDVAISLARSAGTLARDAGVGGELALSDLLALPGVVEVRSSEAAWDEAASRALLGVVDGALEQLLGARGEEGERLHGIVVQKLDEIGGLVAELERLRPQVQATLAETLRERLAAALVESAPLDVDRLAQEVALLADRSNVSEELERLAVHLAHLRGIAGESGPVGKRLDFLVQEVFRELNTASAKCRSSDMTRLCVDAKVLCEELREQLRNVE